MTGTLKEFLSRHRWSAGAVTAFVVLSIVLVQTVPFVGMGWASLTGGPDLGVVRDIRHTLVQQQAFREALAKHERRAIARHRSTGDPAYQRRRLVRVNLTPLGLPGFHDVFAVRVRTDIVDGQAYTSFLARPGVVFDPNAAPFFSRQCDGSACTAFIRSLVAVGHTLLSWDVLTPFRLNITEMDATSSVSIGTEPVSTSTWANESNRLHRQGKGRSFLPVEP